MKDEGIGAVTEDLDNVTTLEEAKSVSSDDALLMSMGKKPELRRGMVPFLLQDLAISGTDKNPQSTISGPCAPTRS